MRLRTLAGAYAGEIREYSHQAGRSALAAGTAEPMESPSIRPAVAQQHPSISSTTLRPRPRLLRKHDAT